MSLSVAARNPFRGLHLSTRLFTKHEHKGGPVQQVIERKLMKALNPAHLCVENESTGHNVPKGSETHFRVTVVSDAFEGKSLVQQHSLVYDALKEELKTGVHALAIETQTSAQWEKQREASIKSPPCRGGMQHNARKSS